MNRPIVYVSFICTICIGLTYFGFKTFMFYYKNVLKGIVLLLHVVKWSFSFGCSHTIRSNMPIVSKKSLYFFLNHALFLCKSCGTPCLEQCFMIVRGQNRGNTSLKLCEKKANSQHLKTFHTISRSDTGFLPVSHTTHLPDILGASSVLNIPCWCGCGC